MPIKETTRMLLDGNYERRPATPKNKGIYFVAMLVGFSVAISFLLATLFLGKTSMDILFWLGKGG